MTLLSRFAQADTIVPGAGNPVAWDRYAYSNNRPISLVDPSGHSSEIPDWLNPFTYDVLAWNIKLNIKEIGGLEVMLSGKVNMKAIRDLDLENLDYSANIETDVSLGVSEELVVEVGISGSEGSIRDQAALDIIGINGVPINLGGCPTAIGVCLNGNAVFDGRADNGVTSSISYAVGVGEGFDLSIDLLQMSDWAYYGKPGENHDQIPYFNKEWWVNNYNKFFKAPLDKQGQMQKE